MNEITLPCCITVFLAWAGGGFVSIVTGFGCGLFALPIMLLAIPPQSAIPVNTVLCCVAMSMILLGFWRNINWRHVGLLSLPAFPAAILGIFLLKTVNIRYIQFGFGVFLLLCVAWELTRLHFLAKHSARPGTWLELIFACIAGVINGIIGLGGPAMGAYAALAGWDKDMTRGTFGMFFGLNLTFCAVLLFSEGFIGAAEAKLIFWAVPGALAGTLAGIPVAKRIRQDLFVRLLLALITLSGLAVIGKSLI